MKERVKSVNFVGQSGTCLVPILPKQPPMMPVITQNSISRPAGMSNFQSTLQPTIQSNLFIQTGHNGSTNRRTNRNESSDRPLNLSLKDNVQEKDLLSKTRAYPPAVCLGETREMKYKQICQKWKDYEAFCKKRNHRNGRSGWWPNRNYIWERFFTRKVNSEYWADSGTILGQFGTVFETYF